MSCGYLTRSVFLPLWRRQPLYTAIIRNKLESHGAPVGFVFRSVPAECTRLVGTQRGGGQREADLPRIAVSYRRCSRSSADHRIRARLAPAESAFTPAELAQDSSSADVVFDDASAGATAGKR